MRVRVIPTSGRSATGSDADAVQPRLNVAARPYAAPGKFGLMLNRAVHAFRVIRPIERETVADEPLAKVSAVHGASRDRAPVLIQ